MSLTIALTNLAALTVPGVTHNFALNSLPEQVARTQLPILLVLPGGLPAGKPQPPGEGFTALAFSNGARTVTVQVTHLLLTAPVASGRGPASHLPALIDRVDAYLAALAADVTLGGALLEPARVGVAPGTFPYGGVTYHGCAFQHEWHIGV
jgi:hypothetical protein